MSATAPEWFHLAIYAVFAALLIMLLQRLPFVGRLVRFAFSAGTGIAPVVLRTANGATTAETGKIDELRVGNIVARIVTARGLGSLDVLGMNFLSRLESWRVEGRTLILVPHHPQNGNA